MKMKKRIILLVRGFYQN